MEEAVKEMIRKTDERLDGPTQWWYRPSIGPRSYGGQTIYQGQRVVAINVRPEDAERIVQACNATVTPRQPEPVPVASLETMEATATTEEELPDLPF